MSTIRRLSIALDADLSGLRSGFSEAADLARSLDNELASSADRADALAHSADAAGAAVRAMAAGGAGGGGGGEISLPGVGNLSGLGTQIRAAMMDALAPLMDFAQRFGAAFDALGGTFVTLAQRLDMAMKQSSGFAERQLKRSQVAYKAISAAALISATAVGIAFGGPFAALIAVNMLAVQFAFYKAFNAITNFARRTVSTIKGYFVQLGSVTKNGLATIGKGAKAFAGGVSAVTGVTAAGKAASGAFGSFKLSLLQAAGAATAVGAAGVFLLSGIKGAISLAETVSKVDQAFGASAGKVHDQAAQMARDFGLPKQAILDASTAIGLLGKGAGKSREEAATLGTDMTKLAADAASFYNVPIDEALQKIQSGLAGQSEPLRSFGVLLSEDAVKAQALKMGLANASGELSEGAKVTARAALITKGLADATGDLERTQGSTANQTKKLLGGIDNLGVTLGGALLPGVDAGLGFLNSFVSGVQAFVDENKALFAAIGAYFAGTVKSLGEGIAAIKGSLGGIPAVFERTFGPGPRQAVEGAVKFIREAAEMIQLVWRNLPDFAVIAFIKFREMFINLGEWLGVLPQNLKLIGEYIAGNWTKLIQDAFNFIISVIKNLAYNIQALGTAIGDFLGDPTKGFHVNWTPLLDGFKATAEKFPEMIRPTLTSLQGEIDAKVKIIADRELQRAERLAQEAKDLANKVNVIRPEVPGDLDAEGKKKKGAHKKEHAFAGAFQLGSREANSLALSATLSRKSGDNATLDVNRQQLAEQKRTTAAIIAGKPVGVEKKLDFL